MQDQQHDGAKAKSSDADLIILLKWAAVITSILLLGRLAIVGSNQLNAPFDLVFETTWGSSDSEGPSEEESVTFAEYQLGGEGSASRIRGPQPALKKLGKLGDG